jgi:hypothetical protein
LASAASSPLSPHLGFGLDRIACVGAGASGGTAPVLLGPGSVALRDFRSRHVDWCGQRPLPGSRGRARRLKRRSLEGICAYTSSGAGEGQGVGRGDVEETFGSRPARDGRICQAPKRVESEVPFASALSMALPGPGREPARDPLLAVLMEPLRRLFHQGFATRAGRDALARANSTPCQV